MSFKSKAETQFEIKFAAAMREQDFELMEKVLNQYGCYLELIVPLHPSYGLPVCLCPEGEKDLEDHEAHAWADDTGVEMWCAFLPVTAGQMIEGENTKEAIMARVTAATEKALKES